MDCPDRPLFRLQPTSPLHNAACDRRVGPDRRQELAGSSLRPVPRCRNDGIQRALSLPFQGTLCKRRIGDKLRGIPGAPCPDLRRNRMSSDVLYCINHLFNRVTLAGSEIHGNRFGGCQVLQAQYVGFRQVIHMNVVADAGAICSRIVIAVDGECGPFALNCLEDNRNQMALGIMHLPNRATFIGSRRIEVAEADVLQAVSCAVSLERIFEREFGGAIGVHRLLRTILGDRALGGIAVHRSRRGEDELANSRVHHTIKQGDRRSDVVVVVLFGILHRFAHRGVRGKEHHRLAAAEKDIDLCLIGEVPDHQLKAFGQLFVAGGEIVVDDDVVSAIAQNLRGVTADVSSSPNNQNGQASSLDDCS